MCVCVCVCVCVRTCERAVMRTCEHACVCVHYSENLMKVCVSIPLKHGMETNCIVYKVTPFPLVTHEAKTGNRKLNSVPGRNSLCWGLFASLNVGLHIQH